MRRRPTMRAFTTAVASALLPITLAAQGDSLRVTTVLEGGTSPRYMLNKPAYVAIILATSRDVEMVWPVGSGAEAQRVDAGSRPIPARTSSVNSPTTVATGSGGVRVAATAPGGISRPVPRGWIVIASTMPLAFDSPADAEEKIRNAIAAAEKKREVLLDERLSLALASVTRGASQVSSDRVYSDGSSPRPISRTPTNISDPCDPKAQPQDRAGQIWRRTQCGDVPSNEVPKPTPLPTTKVPGAAAVGTPRTPER